MTFLQTATSCYTTQGNNLLTCALDDIVAAFGGEAMFGLLVGGAITFALYLAGDGDVRTPAAVLILISGTIFGALPSRYATMGLTFGVLGLAAAIYTVLENEYMDGV